MVKVTLADIEQMSDSQRIIFKAGVAFERERILKLIEKSFTYKDFDLKDYLVKEIKKGR
jgi:hypothetical protein